MSSWFVKPETVFLKVGDQKIEVKKRLTSGEQRKAYARTVSEVRADGRVTPNFEMLGKSEVLAYLVDWTLTDDSGAKVRIDTEARKEAAIDSLATEHFTAIAQAITAHAEAMGAERDAEKNDRGTSSESKAT